MKVPISHKSSPFDAIERSPWGEVRLKIERCEDRLVLSALPLFDVTHHLLEDPSLDLEWSAGQAEHDTSTNQPLPGPSSTPLASVAHEQTGWADVQRLFGLRGDRQTVAVIDSGIAWDHVALGQGFGPGYRVVGGWDFAESDARPYDDAPAGFHGTHVSGIIGAEDPNRSGVAPGVDLVALRVFDDAGKGQLLWTESALRWVHQNRNTFASPITTVNLSLGSTWNSGTVPSWGMLEDELQQLQQDGIVVVASAGNSFKQYNTPGLSYPAASPYVIPVASIDANGQLSDFSQRHERVLAAPGRQILSTVPDHVFGTDGVVNDWSTANGTSMAAPYVSGSAVLVREAMEMVGRSSITPQEIYQWMSDTADTVWDNATKATYERLNLGRAIEALFPTDTVGDSWTNASQLTLQNTITTDGWLNALGDRDAFRFSPTSDGVLNVTAQSAWLQGSSWSLWVDGQAVSLADPLTAQINLQAGHSYALGFSDSDQIGSYQLHWSFDSMNSGGGDTTKGDPPLELPTDLGAIDYRELAKAAGREYLVEASRQGILSIVVQGDQATAGTLEIRDSQGAIVRDTTLENGQWRIDVDTALGSKWTIRTPNTAGQDAQLWLANILQRDPSTLHVFGTQSADNVEIDLNQGLQLTFENVAYRFSEGTIANMNLDLASGSDSVRVLGSSFAEKVELRPELSSIENQRMAIDLRSTEEIDYSGGGGPDRVYLYGSTSDDTLTARPRDVELVGAGYRFHAEQVERTYVHAEQGGQDIAYLFDSQGDDRLSVRPQFSSMAGGDYFNYASGIERVYAYSNAGGIDAATLYDSSASDTYYTSGDIASMVGTGFFSYTRYFESVEAVSSAGGKDTASVYATDRNSLLVGSDFAGYQDANWSRIARGFATAKTFVNNQLIETMAFNEPLVWQIAVDSMAQPSGGLDSAAPMPVSMDFRAAESPVATTAESWPEAEAGALSGVRYASDSIGLSDAAAWSYDETEMVTLSEPGFPVSMDDRHWLDLDFERQLLDEVFAQHGLRR